MLTCHIDSDFNEELVPGSKSAKQRLISESLLEKGLAAHYKGDTYIYLFGSNCWSNLTSSEAQVQLCEIIKSTNVSVSYLKAVEPFIPYIEVHASKVGAIPVSMCAGTKRLEVRLVPNGLRMREVTGLVPMPEESGIHSCVSGFNLMPCTDPMLPDKWDVGGITRLEAYISPLFESKTELNTLKWLLGGILLDPMAQARFVLMYGQGGTGKSTIINVAEMMMKGGVGVIPNSVFTNNYSDPPLSALVQATSKRVAVSGEIDLRNKKMNLHSIKSLTGGDKVLIPPMRVTTCCTIIAAANDLPNLERDSEWFSSQISRRVVVQPFSVNATEIPKADMPDRSVDVLDFKMSCIYTRLTNQDMPVSVRAALLTLLGDSYYTIAEDIIEDEHSSMVEVIEANKAIETWLDLPEGSLGRYAYYLTASCVTTYDRTRYFNRIKCKC